MSSTYLYLEVVGDGRWRIPRAEFDEARKVFDWLDFRLLTHEQIRLFEAWAETRPNVVRVPGPASTDDKAKAMREMIQDVRLEASGALRPGSSPLEGTFARPALERLIEAISVSDAVYYLDARESPATS